MPETRIIDLAAAPVAMPPSQDELPYSDGIPMESQRHKLQIDILIDTLLAWLSQREDGFVGGNMFVYFSLRQVRNQDFRGPDFFVVLGVPKGERKSWVVWEEGKGPDVVIELLSESTAELDKTEKKQIYQNQLRVSEYFWFSPFNPNDWAGFVLGNGVYVPLALDSLGRFISEQLGLALVLWQGEYKGVSAVWLRWSTIEGVLLPTPQEEADSERTRADSERTRADSEQTRAELAERRSEQLAAQLRAMGVEPEVNF